MELNVTAESPSNLHAPKIVQMTSCTCVCVCKYICVMFKCLCTYVLCKYIHTYNKSAELPSNWHAPKMVQMTSCTCIYIYIYVYMYVYV